MDQVITTTVGSVFANMVVVGLVSFSMGVFVSWASKKGGN